MKIVITRNQQKKFQAFGNGTSLLLLHGSIEDTFADNGHGVYYYRTPAMAEMLLLYVADLK